VGVGGLNEEPDPTLKRAARIRRMYIMQERRGQGLGRALLEELREIARFGFDILTVNAGTPAAARFFEHLGLQPVDHSSITHLQTLDSLDATRPNSDLPT